MLKNMFEAFVFCDFEFRTLHPHPLIRGWGGYRKWREIQTIFEFYYFGLLFSKRNSLWVHISPLCFGNHGRAYIDWLVNCMGSRVSRNNNFAEAQSSSFDFDFHLAKSWLKFKQLMQTSLSGNSDFLNLLKTTHNLADLRDVIRLQNIFWKL